MAERRFHFKRILCPVDFSSASLRAFDFATHLAALQGARIHLLHVIPRIVVSLRDIPVATSRWIAAQEEKAKRELQKLKQRAAKSGISASTEIRIGDIDFQILKAARDTGSDLLALGSHGRRGFERWILGSVAESVVRYSPIPILLTSSKGRRVGATIRKILITSDFSKGTKDAVGYAMGIARQANASVMMLHVIPDQSAAVDGNTFPDQTAAIHKRLEALIPPPLRDVCEIKAHVETGQPYRVILKTMEKSRPSLVVLNTHGHGFIDRILIGSTAERVVRGGAAICPMLLVPPRGQ